MVKLNFFKNIIFILAVILMMGLSNFNKNIFIPVHAAAGDNVSGWAWSENIGWISFNRNDTGAPPAAPFNGVESYIAKADLGSNPMQVSGWARVLANDVSWDGWIKFRGASYGIEIDPDSQDFSGWAWGGDVVGWISFNNITGGGKTVYKAIANGIVALLNMAPSVSVVSTIQPDYCVSGPTAILNWSFADPDFEDFQSAYQVQTDNDADFSSPVDDSGKVFPSSSTSYSTPTGKLQYNSAYQWRVKVWDNHNEPSLLWVDSAVFSTPLHAYPTVDFIWSPECPVVNETVQFLDQTDVYGSEAVSWLWTIPGATYVGGTDALSQNPKVKFGATAGGGNVILQVTQNIGGADRTCVKIKLITIKKTCWD